jgi:hypothetical protein
MVHVGLAAAAAIQPAAGRQRELAGELVVGMQMKMELESVVGLAKEVLALLC